MVKCGAYRNNCMEVKWKFQGSDGVWIWLVATIGINHYQTNTVPVRM